MYKIKTNVPCFEFFIPYTLNKHIVLNRNIVFINYNQIFNREGIEITFMATTIK